MPATARTDGARRLVRGAWSVTGSRASWLRLQALRARYSGLRLVGDVHLSPGCTIYVSPRGSLVLDNVHISRGVTITVDGDARIVIGADYIGPNSVLVARESITIGDGTKIAELVVIRDADHDHTAPLRDLRFSVAPVEIGEDVWVGAHAVVLRGVSIGDHATVGAGAVVTRTVREGTTVVGVPAREVTGSTHEVDLLTRHRSMEHPLRP